MLKTKVRYYRTNLGHKPVRVWKLGPVVLWCKPVSRHADIRRIGV